MSIRTIRDRPEEVEQALTQRGVEVDIDQLLRLDETWRRRLHRLETLRAKKNSASEAIGERKKQGEDADDLIRQVRQINEEIDQLEAQVSEDRGALDKLLLNLPNLPADGVPLGENEADNVEVKRHGALPEFPFEPKPHWDLAEDLRLLDFERAPKLAGAQFPLYRGLGARLERALISFMLDIQVKEHNYEEVLPPFLATPETATGSGQLPKFADDMFHEDSHDLYLIPTAEMPLVNLHRDEILDGDELPRAYTAWTPCFRREAGAHGRDTRGLIRVHQFNKVELVQITRPDQSWDILEQMLVHAETVLRRLDLPYRVVTLCSGDMSFASAKTYDIEVWLPSYGEYKEVSSVSNCTAFQARRAGIRYRPSPGAGAELCHTLNGSGLAVGRTLAALLENHQQEDGTVQIPEDLRPYVNGRELVEVER